MSFRLDKASVTSCDSVTVLISAHWRHIQRQRGPHQLRKKKKLGQGIGLVSPLSSRQDSSLIFKLGHLSVCLQDEPLPAPSLRKRCFKTPEDGGEKETVLKRRRWRGGTFQILEISVMLFVFCFFVFQNVVKQIRVNCIACSCVYCWGEVSNVSFFPTFLVCWDTVGHPMFKACLCLDWVICE